MGKKKKDFDVSEQITPRVVRVDAACYALSCGKDQLYRLINSGEIKSYLDGKARKIDVASIDQYTARRLAEPFARASYPKREEKDDAWQQVGDAAACVVESIKPKKGK
jgi:excisionase family DNA binding protein